MTHGTYAIAKILFKCPAFIKPMAYGVSAEIKLPNKAEVLFILKN